MKRYIYLLLVFLISLVSCQKSQDGAGKNKIILEVDQAVLDFVNTNLNKVVFYTSKSNPIRSLDEIKCTNEEEEPRHAGWLTSEDFLYYTQFLKVAGTNCETIRGIGDGNFAKLFKKNRNLKLFLTYLNYEKVITTQGGGIRVEFVSKNQSGK